MPNIPEPKLHLKDSPRGYSSPATCPPVDLTANKIKVLAKSSLSMKGSRAYISLCYKLHGPRKLSIF